MIYYELGKKRHKINLLDKSWISKIYDLGRFKYEYDDINFEKKEITIHIESEKRDNEYGDFQKIIEKYLFQTCELFSMHKRERQSININEKRVPLWFLDEIHFIGITFVENVKSMSKKEMPTILEKIDLQLDETNIKEEYDNMKRIDSSIPFISIDDNGFVNDTWWMKENTFPSQTFKSKKTFIELMGLFVRKEHTIYICEENIKRTMKGLVSFDSWFSSKNEKKFIELILLHEIGHSVFQYIGFSPSVESIKNETRANYFSSLVTHGNFDDKIYLLTIFQPFIYRFPYLSFQFMNNRYFLKTEYSQLLKDYFKMVGVLYESRRI